MRSQALITSSVLVLSTMFAWSGAEAGKGGIGVGSVGAAVGAATNEDLGRGW